MEKPILKKLGGKIELTPMPENCDFLHAFFINPRCHGIFSPLSDCMQDN